MYSLEQIMLETAADDLEEDIIKAFGKYRVNIGLKKLKATQNMVIFLIKMKGRTQESHIRAHIHDVQLRLKLPLNIEKRGYYRFLIASHKEITLDNVLETLNNKNYLEIRKQMQLPYVVGHDSLNNLSIVDLAQLRHLLLGGSSGSGKSVGLQALITSIASSKSPSEVGLILIDVGANDLMPFEGIPHLSCPVVHDRAIAEYVLTALVYEMECRIVLERDSPTEFNQLPSLVLVIDEFPALFTGAGKELSKELTDILSSLLQRGRHAKIHLVLAAQNPTFQNMKIDLGNITARIAFQCAKKNFSETIIGERGAEDLKGKGELLFKSSLPGDLQRLQGVYISPQELQQAVAKIKSNISDYIVKNKFEIAIPDDSLERLSNPTTLYQPPMLAARPSDEDRMFAQVVCWALGKETLSTNLLVQDFKFGWSRAARYVKRLEEWGIVDNPKSKIPRHVIPMRLEDLSAEFIEFMQYCGISEGSLLRAFVEG